MEPVRCFTCNAVLHFRRYEQLAAAGSPLEALQAMCVRRFCCRRMYISHPVELEEHIRSFPLRDATYADYSVRFTAERPSVVATD